jgi:predicted AAA+ superfamily ATPase
MGQKLEQSSESSGDPSLQEIFKFNFQVESEKKNLKYIRRRRWRNLLVPKLPKYLQEKLLKTRGNP